MTPLQIIFIDQILSEAKKLRSELHLVLTQLLLGDSLAADYLICHLIAHVYEYYNNYNSIPFFSITIFKKNSNFFTDMPGWILQF